MAVGEFTGDSEQGEKPNSSVHLRNLLRTPAAFPAAPSETLRVFALRLSDEVDSCGTLPLCELSGSN